MITLTRLSGSMFALNSDLIERVDSTPDTVITLVDGTKYVVREGLREVVDAIRVYRGAVIAESTRMAGPEEAAAANPPARRLVAVPNSDWTTDRGTDRGTDRTTDRGEGPR